MIVEKTKIYSGGTFFEVSKLESTDATGVQSINAIVRYPAPRGEFPSTSWNLCGRFITAFIKGKPVRKEFLLELEITTYSDCTINDFASTYSNNPTNSLFWTSRHGNTERFSGFMWPLYLSQTRSKSQKTPEETKNVIVTGDFQPWSIPVCSSAATRRTEAANRKVVPRKSIFVKERVKNSCSCCGEFGESLYGKCFGMVIPNAIRATTPIGTLKKQS